MGSITAVFPLIFVSLPFKCPDKKVVFHAYFGACLICYVSAVCMVPSSAFRLLVVFVVAVGSFLPLLAFIKRLLPWLLEKFASLSFKSITVLYFLQRNILFALQLTTGMASIYLERLKT